MTVNTTNRPLGDLEYTYWLMDLASRTNFTVLAEVEGLLCPNEEDIIRAIDRIASYHSMLGVRIAIGENGKMTFFPSDNAVSVRIDHLNQTRPDSFPDEKDTTDILNEEQHLSLDWENGPLMRARLLVFETGKKIILLTFHHAIAVF